MMNDPLGIRQIDSPKCLYPNHFIDNLSWCAAGFWCGQVRSDVGNPDLFLLHPGYLNDLPVGVMGELHPINANLYRQLTFRMYIDSVDPGDPGFQVMWTNGTVADIGNPPKWGQTIFYKTYPGWNIYTIDLGLYTNGSLSGFGGTLPWANNITGLRLDPGFSGMNNRIVQLNWVRLTPIQNRPLAWSTNQSGPLTITLQTTGVNDILRQYTIVSNYSTPTTIDASAGSTNLPESLPGGAWTVQLGVGSQTSAAAGPWVVQPLPQARFVHPGFNTGQDYAVTVLHRPWDMSGPQSIYQYAYMSAPVFGNNILTSTTNALTNSGCSGPWADPSVNLLNDNYWSPPITTDPPIDTAKFHLLTAHVKLDGTPDVSYGWVFRVNWSNADKTGGFQHCGTTKNFTLHAGWNDIVVDLASPDLLDPYDPCNSEWLSQTLRQQLRIDPSEDPDATAVHLGPVQLTAAETVTKGLPFKIALQTTMATGAVATYYYNTQKYTSTGQLPVLQYAPVLPGPYRSYLPAAWMQVSAVSFGGTANAGNTAYLWDTSGVTPGTYYISVALFDGYNTTVAYSDAPVMVVR